MKKILLKKLKCNWRLQTSTCVIVMPGRLDSILREEQMKILGLKAEEGDVQMAGHRSAALEGVSLGSDRWWNLSGKEGG